MNSFAWALAWLKEGRKVRRKEWPVRDYMVVRQTRYAQELFYMAYEEDTDDSSPMWFECDEQTRFDWFDINGNDWEAADAENPNDEEF